MLHKRMCITTAIFTEFLRVQYASICVPGRKICCLWALVLFIHKIQYVISTGYEICILPTRLYEHDPFH
jgi:hypothetical protein